MLGRVEDPANELLNGDVYMTNSKRDPAPPQSTAAQSTSSNNHIHRRSVFCADFLMPIVFEAKLPMRKVGKLLSLNLSSAKKRKTSKEKYIQK